MAAAAVLQELYTSSDEDADGAGILSLADGPAFSDVQPLELSEPERPVVAVQYSDEAQQRLAYLYALVAAGEVSERALRLTAQVIGDNPANYTAWICRWRCLRAGHGSKASELAFLHSCTLAGGAKNYQLWNHRRRIALQLVGALNISEEMRFAADCLVLEPKNYHAWAHRQAVLLAAAGITTVAGSSAAPPDEPAPAEPCSADSTAGGSGGSGEERNGGGGCGDWWAAELDYVESCIGADARDNSAWAQRFFLLRHRPALFSGDPGKGSISGGAGYSAIAGHELAFVAEQLQRGAHNGSAWNYLRGLLTLPGGGDAWLHDERLPQLCCQILAEEPPCAGALELLADVYAARATGAADQHDNEIALAAMASALAVWQELALADPVRRCFWDSRSAALQERCFIQR